MGQTGCTLFLPVGDRGPPTKGVGVKKQEGRKTKNEINPRSLQEPYVLEMLSLSCVALSVCWLVMLLCHAVVVQSVKPF